MFRRILFDVSDTIQRPYNTGIQRVVRGVLQQMPAVVKKSGAELVPMVVKGTSPFRVSIDDALYTEDAASLTKSTSRSVTHSWLRRVLMPWQRPSLTREQIEHHEMAWEPGDLYLSLDACWVLPMAELLPMLRERQVTSGLLVHDIIPLRYPQFTVPAHTELFGRFTKTVINEADFLLTNSETTRDDLVAYSHEHGLNEQETPLADRVMSVKLGSEICRGSLTSSVTPKIKDLFSRPGVSTYITVGSFEPKKNQVFAYHAFTELCQSHPNVQLVMIGRVGWYCEHVLEEIRQHPLYDKQIFVVHDASDEDLAYAYRKAKALVFPSVTEGFGIPVVEALQQKTNVLCSDIAIFREIGGDHCLYFSLDEPGSLAKLVEEIEAKRVELPPLRGVRMTSWRDCAQEVVDKCHHLGSLAKHRIPTTTTI